MDELLKNDKNEYYNYYDDDGEDEL